MNSPKRHEELSKILVEYMAVCDYAISAVDCVITQRDSLSRDLMDTFNGNKELADQHLMTVSAIVKLQKKRRNLSDQDMDEAMQGIMRFLVSEFCGFRGTTTTQSFPPLFLVHKIRKCETHPLLRAAKRLNRYLNDRLSGLQEKVGETATVHRGCLEGDMKDSEKFTKAVGSAKATSILNDVTCELERIAGMYHGVLTFYEGDKFVAMFKDLGAAASAAIRMQKLIRTKNGSVPTAAQVLFRMAVHCGKVSILTGRPEFDKGPGLIGAARILAAGKRLSPKASSGKIFTDQSGYEQLKALMPKISFKDLRQTEIKGHRYHIWELRWG